MITESSGARNAALMKRWRSSRLPATIWREFGCTITPSRGRPGAAGARPRAVAWPPAHLRGKWKRNSYQELIDGGGRKAGRRAAQPRVDGRPRALRIGPDGRVKKALHLAHDTQHARPRDQPLPAAAQGQSGSLAALGRGGFRSREEGRQADPPLDRLRRLPLVPCDGG